MEEQSKRSLDVGALLEAVLAGDKRMLARGISLIENETPGYERLLEALPKPNLVGTIGVTGPPGVGKSTLVDGLMLELMGQAKSVAVLCVDPSSPFHHGALLGDRIRMSGWHTHPSVFIRSLATRGALGGLSPKIIEIMDLVKAAGFDYLIVETVGVGQVEVEISALADTTVVVLVPESGDEVQTMKAGLMEIADIFVVNKADRPGADRLAKNLQHLVSQAPPGLGPEAVAIFQTIATQKQGVAELAASILARLSSPALAERRTRLLAEKAFQLIVQRRTRDIDREELIKTIRAKLLEGPFNLYRFVSSY
jgi:LAO/AO transport system kinase